MRAFKKQGMSVLLGLMLILLGAAARPAAGPIPDNVHPDLVQAVRRDPGGLLRVIVARAPDQSTVTESAAGIGAQITADWGFIHTFAAELPGYRLGALAALPGVRLVLPDQPVLPQGRSVETTNLLSAFPYAVGAEQLWAKGYDGAGVTVAIVDSGLSEAGPNDFGNRLVRSVKFNSATKYAADKYGHGTHVAAIVGGNGASSKGQYIGIAPGVNLINVKFSDDEGKASERDLVSALQWVYENREKERIRVVNISSNVGTVQSYRESAVAAAVEQLWFGGVVVVVSAGNRGEDPCAVCYAPANDPFVLSVGAMDDRGTRDLLDDVAKGWSSRGVTLDKHQKPELLAPGARIISYMPSGALRKAHPANQVGEQYFQMGGTSMAAPVVSGVVALLLQARPELTPDEVKWLLMASARTYQEQPAGTAGVVAAAEAVAWSQPIGKANQGLERSPLLDAESGTVAYGSTSWANVSWANTSWANSVQY